MNHPPLEFMKLGMPFQFLDGMMSFQLLDDLRLWAYHINCSSDEYP